MSIDDIKELLLKFGWEYKISFENDTIYSPKYRKMIVDEVYEKTFKYGDKFFKNKIKIIELNGIKYKIEYLEDITKYIEFVLSLKKDKLTGLYTREELESYIGRLKKNSIIVLCDIDDFKKVNDTCGHQVGDEVLTILGKIIRNNIRKTDFAGRYGGEEFLIIFDTDNLPLVQKRINEINRQFNQKTDKLNLTFSAGISVYNGSEEITETIKDADIALYYVKQNGKNNSAIYDKKMEQI